MGHLHSAALRCFCNGGGKSGGLCTSCVIAKSHRHPFRSSLPQADRLLYRVHADVLGPFQVLTPSGNQYFFTFIDEHSRYAKIYLIKKKADVFKRFHEFISEAERHTGNQLCILTCDRGGKYTSSHLLPFCATDGIQLEQRPAHTPEQNSIAERYNQTIMERLQAQMVHAALPKFIWGEVVLATSYIMNMSTTNSTPDICITSGKPPVLGVGHTSPITLSYGSWVARLS